MRDALILAPTVLNVIALIFIIRAGRAHRRTIHLHQGVIKLLEQMYASATRALAHERTDLDHLLAALSVEKSKPIPEIRDLYGLNEGERP